MRYFVLLIVVLLVLAGLRWGFWPHSRVPRFRVRYLRTRLHLRLHPGRGHATVTELWWRWGRLAAFRRSARSRASLSWWQRLCGPDRHSILLGRAHYRHGLRVPVEEHLLIMAPPRTGKTGLLARIILHYPGPVVSTTTKHDVYQLTSAVRDRVGPVQVFNPQRIGGVPSTFSWDPVAGCEDPATAIRRADGFAHAVSMAGTEDASFWSAKASSYLRALFHAAALAGGDMHLVTQWALGTAEQAEDVLVRAGAGQWALELAELRGEAQKTAQTIRMVVSRALAFMTDPALAAAALPDGGRGFDIARFLDQRGTVYLIAESAYDDSPVAPLFAALATEIHHTAAQRGQASPSQRLDPPLLLALDEIVQTCPIPLPSWLADSGGKGIQLIPVAHGEAQLRTRWGQDGAQVVLDTCGVKVFLPGITDTATLKMASELCGQASFREPGHERGRDYRVWHDVLTPDMIRQLPARHALIVRTSHAPVIARLVTAWHDPAYRRARRTTSGAAVKAGLSRSALRPGGPVDPADELPGPAEPPADGPATWPQPDQAGWSAEQSQPQPSRPAWPAGPGWSRRPAGRNRPAWPGWPPPGFVADGDGPDDDSPPDSRRWSR